MISADSKVQDAIIQRAMVAMGWNPNSEIPMANEENLCILAGMERLAEEKVQLLESQIQTEDRLAKLRQHSKNAEMCLNQNLKLLQAHQAEVKTEIHLYKVAERVHSKLNQDIKAVSKSTESYRAYMETTESELCKRKNAIDDLTKRVKWAKTVLLEWREAMGDTQKGYQLIEKYFKEDQLLATQKELRRQLLHNEIEKCRQELVKLYDEQKTLEQNLDCTSTLYRAAHQERRELVDTWKAAVQRMLQREKDITDNEEFLVKLKADAQKSTEQRKRYDKRLDDLIKNNHDVEHEIEQLNDETSDIKEQIQQLMDAVILKESEVELLQKDLQNLSNHVQQQRQDNRKLAQEKARRLQELSDFAQVLYSMESRLREMEDKNTSAQTRLQILEDMIDVETKSQQDLNKELARVNSLLYRALHHVAELNSEIKVLEVSNSGLSTTQVAVKRNTVNMEKEMQRKQELLYTAGFKCLKLEKTISQMFEGFDDPVEEQERQEQLAKLELQNIMVNKRLQATEAQNKKLDDNMRNLTEVYNHGLKTLEVTSFQIKEAQLYCEGGVKRLKAELHTNQLKIVELSIMKMRVSEFETEITACENNTYSLGRHRVQLNRTMKDRMVEIKSQMDLLNLKRKHLNEERSTLLADIGERSKHIEVVSARFELTSKLLGTNEDGTLVTATQLKVEAAQEKQILLEEGNELNDKVLKAEEEIKAMENTLLLLNDSNDAYRRNLNKKVDEDQVLQEMKYLQTNYCHALSQLKSLRNKLHFIDRENDKTLTVLEGMERQLEILDEKNMRNKEVLEKLQKELNDQKVKLQRAEREMKNALKRVRERSLGKEFVEAFEHELDLRELEYRNTSALNQLADMAENDAEIGPKVMRIMYDKGLKMPHQLQKVRSFASWRSEVSDTSSSRDVPGTSSRSSVSGHSHLETSIALQPVSTIVSFDFPS